MCSLACWWDGLWVGCVGWLCRCFVAFIWGPVVWSFVYVVDLLDNFFVVLVDCLNGS